MTGVSSPAGPGDTPGRADAAGRDSVPGQPTPAQLLAAARAVVGRPGPAWGASWPRAAAIFTRQALEDTIKQLWTGPAAGLQDATFAAQLVCLRSYLGDPDLARRAHLTWCQLSAACHAHPYELAPTAAELVTWTRTVETVIAAVDRVTGSA